MWNWSCRPEDVQCCGPDGDAFLVVDVDRNHYSAVLDNIGPLDQYDDDSSLHESPVDQDIQKTLSILSTIALFQRLPAEELPDLAAACLRKDFTGGTVIVMQGLFGNELYVILSGCVSVRIDGRKVTTFGVGDYFGEAALLRNEPRSATITAEDLVQTAVITREKFQQMRLHEKLEFGKRAAVGGHADNVKAKPPSRKSDEDRKVIKKAIKSNRYLAELVKAMDEQKIEDMIDVAWTQTVHSLEAVIEQGDAGDYFYMVKEGSFTVSVSSGNNQRAQTVSTLARGSSFGELALLYHSPRSATVRAMEVSVVWVIDRGNFKRIMAKSSGDLAREHIRCLNSKKMFNDLTENEKLKVANALVEQNFSEGESIFEQGEKGTAFYILYEGKVEIIKNDTVVAYLEGSLGKMEIFGELALLSGEKRAATVRAITDVKTLELEKASFDHLLGPMAEIQKRRTEITHTDSSRSLQSSRTNRSAPKRGRTTTFSDTTKVETMPVWGGYIFKKDLSRISVLGYGAHATVELVEHTVTGNMYALKTLSKGHVVRNGLKALVMSEKKVMGTCNCPFIISLFETFDSAQTLHFLLEYAPGGDLSNAYVLNGLYGQVPHAQFYAASTVFALDYLHDKKVVYRDLKPENLVLTEKGISKLTDFGLAKLWVGKTYTTCGTPDYFAPEVIKHVGHTFPVDWWALGILTFEFMTGTTPFKSATALDTYSHILRGISTVIFPNECSQECVDLITSLCEEHPADRLPAKRGGVARLMRHAWYKEFDWLAMKQQKLQPPYAPRIKNSRDVSNFAASSKNMPEQRKYTDDGSGWADGFATSS